MVLKSTKRDRKRAFSIHILDIRLLQLPRQLKELLEANTIKRETSSATVMMMKLIQVPSQRTRYIFPKRNTVIRKERQVEIETKEENHHGHLVINLQELPQCLNDQKEKSGNQKGSVLFIE